MVHNRKPGSNQRIAISFDTLREKEKIGIPCLAMLRSSLHKVCQFKRLFREKLNAESILILSHRQ